MPYRTILKTTIPWTSTIDVSRVTTSKMRCRTILKTTIPWTLTIEKTHYFLDHFEQLLESYLWYRSRKKWFNLFVFENKKSDFPKPPWQSHLNSCFSLKMSKMMHILGGKHFFEKMIFVWPPKESTFVHFLIKKITFFTVFTFFHHFWKSTLLSMILVWWKWSDSTLFQPKRKSMMAFDLP